MYLTDSELARVCRGLELLLHAGIGLGEGLQLLLGQEQGAVKQTLDAMAPELDAGVPLSQAAQNQGRFPALALGMMAIGEDSGRLEEALHSLADYYDERCRTSRQLRSALLYPTILLALMLVVIAVLLMKVLPVFDAVYASLGSRLTGAGAGLLYLGQALSAGLPVLLGLLGVIAVVYALYRWNTPFRHSLRSLFNRKLGDRGVLGLYNNARFARGLAMGLGSGMPTEQAVALAQRLLADNPGAAARGNACDGAVAEGASLDEALEQAQLVPPVRCRMLRLGLRGGNADQVMADIADHMAQEARQALEDTVSRIEPAMVLISSLLVGLILLSVMLPLVDIMSVIG